MKKMPGNYIKKSAYIPEPLLSELRAEAARLERSVAYLVNRYCSPEILARVVAEEESRNTSK